MKKEKMITRTFEVTSGMVLAMNLDSEEVENRYFTVIGNYDSKSVLSVLENDYLFEHYKPIKVKSISTDECLYGMAESDFLSHAILLPPRKKYDEELEGNTNE